VGTLLAFNNWRTSY